MYQKLSEMKLNCLCTNIRNNLPISADCLNGKDLSDGQVSRLAQAMAYNNSLKMLQLFDINLTQIGKNTLLTALKCNKSIKYLSIRNSVDIEFVLDLLECNTKIEKLYFYDEIGNEGAKRLFYGLSQRNSVVSDIYLRDLTIDRLYLDAIEDMLNFNRKFAFCEMETLLKDIGIHAVEEESIINIELKKLREDPEQALLKAKREKDDKVVEYNASFYKIEVLESLDKLLEKVEKIEELKDKKKQLEKEMAKLQASDINKKEAPQFAIYITAQLVLGLTIDYLLHMEIPSYTWKSLIGFTTIGLLAGGINVMCNKYKDKDTTKEFYFAQQSSMMGYALSLAATSAFSIEKVPTIAGMTLCCTLGFYKLHNLLDQHGIMKL